MSKIDNIDPKMIANNITPFEPTHPGEILKDEIEYRICHAHRGSFRH